MGEPGKPSQAPTSCRLGAAWELHGVPDHQRALMAMTSPIQWPQSKWLSLLPGHLVRICHRPLLSCFSCHQLSWQWHGHGGVQHVVLAWAGTHVLRAALCQGVDGEGIAPALAVEDVLVLPPAVARAGLSGVTHLPRDGSGWPRGSDL